MEIKTETAAVLSLRGDEWKALKELAEQMTRDDLGRYVSWTTADILYSLFTEIGTA